MAGRIIKKAISDAPSKGEINPNSVMSPKGTESNFGGSQIGKGITKIHIPSSSKFSSTMKNMRIKQQREKNEAYANNPYAEKRYTKTVQAKPGYTMTGLKIKDFENYRATKKDKAEAD